MSGSVPGRPTPTQLYVLHAIADLTAFNGYPPSFEEIAAELDYSGKSPLVPIVRRLEDTGWLERRTPRAPRGFVLLREPPPLPEYEVEILAAGRRALEEKRHV